MPKSFKANNALLIRMLAFGGDLSELILEEYCSIGEEYYPIFSSMLLYGRGNQERSYRVFESELAIADGVVAMPISYEAVRHRFFYTV
jgi:hypothetical protein